jgi:hypothetical protein
MKRTVCCVISGCSHGTVGYLSARIRWLAVATGVASALALFPILFLLNPALLIVGGYIQRRFPVTGKWFVWAGAASLWPVVIVYDTMMFPHPFRQPDFPEYMVLTFSATTVFLTWCSVELIADAIRRMRAWASTPPIVPPPVGRRVWVLAAVLNLWLGLGAAARAMAPIWYRYPVAFYIVQGLGNQLGIIVVAFDIFLIWRVAKLRRGRRLGNP